MFEAKERRLLIMLGLLTMEAGAVELRDPTMPPTYADVTIDRSVVNDVVAAYRLSMTKTGGKADIAVINGKSVKVGDVIDGAKITAIRAGEVDIEIGDGKHKLKVQSVVVKQPHQYPEREQ